MILTIWPVYTEGGPGLLWISVLLVSLSIYLLLLLFSVLIIQDFIPSSLYIVKPPAPSRLRRISFTVNFTVDFLFIWNRSVSIFVLHKMKLPCPHARVSTLSRTTRPPSTSSLRRLYFPRSSLTVLFVDPYIRYLCSSPLGTKCNSSRLPSSAKLTEPFLFRFSTLRSIL